VQGYLLYCCVAPLLLRLGLQLRNRAQQYGNKFSLAVWCILRVLPNHAASLLAPRKGQQQQQPVLLTMSDGSQSHTCALFEATA
jgi:hypothetical protein